MSAKRAAVAYDSVVRRIKFLEDHPGVRVEYKRAPEWRWEADWVGRDGEPHKRLHVDLGRLLDTLDAINWASEIDSHLNRFFPRPF